MSASNPTEISDQIIGEITGIMRKRMQESYEDVAAEAIKQKLISELRARTPKSRSESASAQQSEGIAEGPPRGTVQVTGVIGNLPLSQHITNSTLDAKSDPEIQLAVHSPLHQSGTVQSASSKSNGPHSESERHDASSLKKPPVSPVSSFLPSIMREPHMLADKSSPSMAAPSNNDRSSKLPPKYGEDGDTPSTQRPKEDQMTVRVDNIVLPPDQEYHSESSGPREPQVFKQAPAYDPQAVSRELGKVNQTAQPRKRPKDVVVANIHVAGFEAPKRPKRYAADDSSNPIKAQLIEEQVGVAPRGSSGSSADSSRSRQENGIAMSRKVSTVTYCSFNSRSKQQERATEGPGKGDSSRHRRHASDRNRPKRSPGDEGEPSERHSVHGEAAKQIKARGERDARRDHKRPEKRHRRSSTDKQKHSEHVESLQPTESSIDGPSLLTGTRDIDGRPRSHDSLNGQRVPDQGRKLGKTSEPAVQSSDNKGKNHAAKRPAEEASPGKNQPDDARHGTKPGQTLNDEYMRHRARITVPPNYSLLDQQSIGEIWPRYDRQRAVELQQVGRGPGPWDNQLYPNWDVSNLYESYCDGELPINAAHVGYLDYQKVYRDRAHPLYGVDPHQELYDEPSEGEVLPSGNMPVANPVFNGEYQRGPTFNNVHNFHNQAYMGYANFSSNAQAAWNRGVAYAPHLNPQTGYYSGNMHDENMRQQYENADAVNCGRAAAYMQDHQANMRSPGEYI